MSPASSTAQLNKMSAASWRRWLIPILAAGLGVGLIWATTTFVPRHREPTPAVAPHPYQVGYNPKLAFAIHRGEGLADYVGYDEAIDVAQQFKLEVRNAGRPISYAQARQRSLNRLKVNVVVDPGDRFDLNGPRAAWRFTPSRPRR